MQQQRLTSLSSVSVSNKSCLKSETEIINETILKDNIWQSIADQLG